MKFSVGYQMLTDDALVNKIVEYREGISEVYFSFGSFPNGRSSQLLRRDMTPEAAMQKQLSDLAKISSSGVSLNLLFNATCYGKDSQSKEFFTSVGDTVDMMQSELGLASVTTTSPLIAKFIKQNFEGIEVRASVNMEIGSELGIEYISEYFDSFYLKRELNRDLKRVKEIKSFCDRNGKKLYALANSGCLNFCSAHIFHDNLVSHEAEIAKMDNGYAFSGACYEFLAKEENRRRILEVTSFIRPEDTHLYEGLVESLKLATRVNQNPLRVLDAYIGRKTYRGSTLDLCEPNHTGVMLPCLLENSYIRSRVEDGRLVYENIENALIRLEDLC